MRSAAHLALLAASMGELPAYRPRRDPHAYQTDEQRERAKARAEAKRERRRARNLALRDAGGAA